MQLTSLLLIVFGVTAAETGRLCSIGELMGSPDYQWRVERVAQKVDSATRIVRVRAVRADSTARTIVFEPLEWIRGGDVRSSSALVLPGIAVDHDDFNDQPVPYRIVRPSGRRGSCHAEEYRLRREYLLLLQDGSARYPIFWWPLGPVNEQLRGDDDAWLKWVRAHVARSASSRGDT